MEMYNNRKLVNVMCWLPINRIIIETFKMCTKSSIILEMFTFSG